MEKKEKVKVVIWPNGKKKDAIFTTHINKASITSLRRLKDYLIYKNYLKQTAQLDKIKFYSMKGIELEDSDIAYFADYDIVFLIENNTPFCLSNQSNQYEYIKSIKSGGYGHVYLAKHAITGKEYAVKRVGIERYSTDELYSISRENVYLNSFSHKNIIKSYLSFSDEQYVYIIMDYAEGGELTQYIKDNGPLSEEETKRIFTQIYEAVSYIHSKNTIHRDLKTNNILFLDKEYKHIVLIDFGICGFSNGNDQEMIRAGTTAYLPPEIAIGRAFESSPKVDVWSLGVIMYYMLYKELPFMGKNDEEIIQNISTKSIKLTDKKLSVNCRVLLSKMLEKNPKMRIEMNDSAFENWFDNKQVKQSDGIIKKKSRLFFSPSPKRARKSEAWAQKCSLYPVNIALHNNSLDGNKSDEDNKQIIQLNKMMKENNNNNHKPSLYVQFQNEFKEEDICFIKKTKTTKKCVKNNII